MLAPLFDADPAVQLHVLAAIISAGLAPIQLLRKRRDRVHKLVGYVWVLAMCITALSSFWIRGIRVVGPFSPIHLLSLYVLWGLFGAVRSAIRGDIKTHRATMQSMSLWGLGVAGLFTFLPGRMMNEMVFGTMQKEGFAVILVVALLAWQQPWWRMAR